MKKNTELVVGWREWVGLPELNIPAVKAKIDTGARTSAIHAFNVTLFQKNGSNWVRFRVHPVQRHRHPELSCEALVLERRHVTSSNGQREQRYVITSLLKIGESVWPIELTLTDRDEMGFRMLIGREALRRRAIVDPGSSYRFGKFDHSDFYEF